ncbi:MAG: peptidylprolyl isomerase [Magnetococcales bacterium]|nr:peptidylprolyl isomerase [Magnetococcales bacterium]
MGFVVCWQTPLAEAAGQKGDLSRKSTANKPSSTAGKLTRSLSDPSSGDAPLREATSEGSVDRIVAIVEAQIISDQPVRPQIITLSEVDDLIKPTLDKMRSNGEDFQLEALRKRGLEELIVRKLRDQKASQLGVTVTDEDANEIIAQVERKNNLPPGGLPEALRHDGIDYERYRAQLFDQIMENRLIKRVIMPLLTVTDDELHLLYNQLAQDQSREEEFHIGQILLEIPSGASYSELDRVKEKAVALLQSLRDGKSFAALASQYSNDPSGLAGGDAGWVKKADMPENLQEILLPLKVGDISDPIRSPQGLHIFKMIDRRTKETPHDSQSSAYRYKLRHILITVGNKHDDKSSLAKIKELQDKIKGGAAFDQVAREYSEDDASVKEGGDLGWMEPDAILPAFAAALKNLTKGQISQPIKSQFGWHLLKLDDKESSNPNSFEAQKSALEQRLLGTKAKERYQQWLRDLRLRAYVEFP